MNDATMLQYALGGFGVAICLAGSAIWLYVLARRENAKIRQEADRYRLKAAMYKSMPVMQTLAPPTTMKPLVLSDRRFIPDNVMEQTKGSDFLKIEAETMVSRLIHDARPYIKIDSHRDMGGIQLSATLILLDPKDH